MGNINWETITDNEKITEVTRVVDTFNVRLERGPQIKIEILEYPGGAYMGNASHSFWGPEQAGPYKSLHLQNSIEDALNDSIDGFLAFDNPDFPNESVFYVAKDEATNEKVYIDGNGEAISIEEVKERRDQFNKA